MKFEQLAIPDIVVLQPAVYSDERGWFMESFNELKFKTVMRECGLSIPKFVQDNHSCSNRGVLRGLHYQLAPHAQGKLVRVTQGAAYDVAVDIRKESPTYLKWVACELSAENKKMLWIPEGFAHGFLALEDNTHFLYKTTEYYHQASERSLLWSDSAIGIDWPLLDNIIVSEKDASAPSSGDFL